MDYDIEADWILLQACNYRCSYCCIAANSLGTKIKTYGTPMQWKEGFDAYGRTWLLHITGGEPSLYPDFVELCDLLTRNHYLSINSNLSHHSIKAFAQRINPKRVHFINAAIHYETRQQRGSLNVFIEHVHELQEAKFNVLLSLVMTPYVVQNFLEISELLEPQGLFAIPKVLRGTHEGKRYPASYSVKEKRLIGEYILRAEQKYEPIINNMGEPPSINMFSDHRFLKGIYDYRGRLCSAGSKFVSIMPNGTVVRCGPPDILGNILFKKLSLLDGPKLCDTSYCPYFCEKYSIQEGNIYEQPSSNNKKIWPTPSNYSHFKGKILNNYFSIRTDGCIAFTKRATLKLKKLL